MLKKHSGQMKSGTGKRHPVSNLRSPGCLITSVSLHSEKLLNETKGAYSSLNKHLMNTYCVLGNEHNKKMSKKLFHRHTLITAWKGKLIAPHGRAGQELSDWRQAAAAGAQIGSSPTWPTGSGGMFHERGKT